MTSLDRNPKSKNLLSPLVFKFVIKRAPNVNFYIQSVSLPGLMLDQVETSNPFVQYPVPGDHLYYEELGIHFKAQEDLSDWLEIHNWLRDMGFPNDWSEYANIASQPKTSGLGIRSDLSLLIADSNKNFSFEAVFKDAFPISLSNIQLDTTTPRIPYVDLFASFRYTSYDIRKL